LSSDVLYEEGETTVTHAFFRRGAQSWPVSSIVKVTDFKKPFSFVEILFITIGVLFALFAIFQFVLIWVAAGVVIAALCGYYVRDVLKYQYIVCVEFDSGDKEIVRISDRSIGIRLRNAIRGAMGSS